MFDTKLIIGNCLTMTIPVAQMQMNGLLKPQLSIISKVLYENKKVKDSSLSKTVYANNGYEIENTHISILLKEKHFEEKIKKYSNRLSWLKYILDLLKMYHVKKI